MDICIGGTPSCVGDRCDDCRAGTVGKRQFAAALRLQPRPRLRHNGASAHDSFHSCICPFFSRIARTAFTPDPLRRILWSDATCSWRWTFLLVEEMADDGRFSH